MQLHLVLGLRVKLLGKVKVSQKFDIVSLFALLPKQKYQPMTKINRVRKKFSIKFKAKFYTILETEN